MRDDRALLDRPRAPRWLELFWPSRFLVADCIRTQDATLRDVEKAYEQSDPRESARLAKIAMERAMRSRNLLVRMALPSLARPRSSQDQMTARFRLLRVAVRLEKIWLKEGRYPSDPAVLDLPIDPFAYPARLRYASLAEGRGYRLWGVGANGTDEGGRAEDKADEVFERPPR
jgi:hypothetical protein